MQGTQHSTAQHSTAQHGEAQQFTASSTTADPGIGFGQAASDQLLLLLFCAQGVIASSPADD
jgi:hypothetical protein